MKISVTRIFLAFLALPASAFAASNSVVNLSHYDLMRVDFAQMKKQGIVGVIHEASYPRSVRNTDDTPRNARALTASPQISSVSLDDRSVPVWRRSGFLRADGLSRS